MHRTPNSAPAPMARDWCARSETPSANQTERGVRSPTKWPAKSAKTPMWKRLLPKRNCLRASNWLESAFQVYCSRSKRMRLPRKKTLSAM